MNKNLKEIIIICIQLFMFYIFPVFMYLLEPIATVILILVSTFVLSFALAIISNKKIKYLYPVIISVLFLPTVFIYYNESAFVHSIWYLIISTIGLVIGSVIKHIITNNQPNGRINTKKIILIILIFILIGTIICLKNKNEFIIGKESNVNIIEHGISLSVKENTVTKTGITLILKNDNNEEIIYSEPYRIEVKKDNIWHSINVEIDFIEIAYVLKPQHSNEIKINWEEGYGKLSSGEYRVIKEITIPKKDDIPESFFVSAEFTII